MIFTDKKKNYKINTPSVVENNGQPENASEYVNFYGTYNIQPTQMSSNTFPAIGQGLDKKTAERLKKESEEWLKNDNSNSSENGEA